MPRPLMLAAVLLAVVGVADAQNPPPGTPPTASPPGQYVPPGGLAPPGPSKATRNPYLAPPPGESLPAVPAPPAEKSVEQLLKDLEAVQAQKAELLKKESDLKAAIQKKLEAIQKQAEKLGAGPVAGKAAGPAGAVWPDLDAMPRVGRILIEGAANKGIEAAARESLHSVGLAPGAVYRRPALDRAREGMVSAGLGRVSLETVTTGQTGDGGAVVDIRVRIAPDGDR